MNSLQNSHYSWFNHNIFHALLFYLTPIYNTRVYYFLSLPDSVLPSLPHSLLHSATPYQDQLLSVSWLTAPFMSSTSSLLEGFFSFLAPSVGDPNGRPCFCCKFSPVDCPRTFVTNLEIFSYIFIQLDSGSTC